METIKLNELCFMHGERIIDVVFDEKSDSLKLSLEFCEWQLEELNNKYLGMEIVFQEIEQLLAYTELNKLIADKNNIEFLNIKKNKYQKKHLLTFGLNHWTDKIDNNDWFFIEFLCDKCEINYIR